MPISSILLKVVSAAVFLTAMTLVANAEDSQISPESEALYFKALPFLDKIDQNNNDFFTKYKLSKVPINPTAEEQKQRREILRSYLKEGMPSLVESANQNNPVAQARLAWVSSLFDPYAQANEKVCGLLKSSLRRGFSPAALQMNTYCFEYIKTDEFRSLVDALPLYEKQYEKYFPYPAFTLCDHNRNAKIAEATIVLRDEKQILANLYMSMAILMIQGHPQDRITYLKTAAQYGCNMAIESLKTLTSK